MQYYKGEEERQEIGGLTTVVERDQANTPKAMHHTACNAHYLC